MKYIIPFIIFFDLVFTKDKGKNAFDDKRYDEARKYYENIILNRENDYAAKFGLGTTAYKQEDVETAMRFLSDAKNSEDPKLASRAYYNLGNMLREQNKVNESLSFYKKAIQLDPSDQDAKINYELLKQVIQQNKQDQQEQDQQEQDRQEQGQQEQDQQEQDQQEQNRQEQGQQEQDQQEQNKKEKNTYKGNDQIIDQEEKGSNNDKTDEQIQAEAILNALKDQEKINQKRQIRKTRSRKMEKDW